MTCCAGPKTRAITDSYVTLLFGQNTEMCLSFIMRNNQQVLRSIKQPLSTLKAPLFPFLFSLIVVI